MQFRVVCAVKSLIICWLTLYGETCLCQTVFKYKGGLRSAKLSHALSLLIADFEQAALTSVSLQNTQSNPISFAKATEAHWLERTC